MCLYVDNKLLQGETLSHCRPQTSLLLQMIHFIQGTFFSPSPDLNYIPLVLFFCDFVFGHSVAIEVICVLLERTLQSTFHDIVKSFQSQYPASLRALHITNKEKNKKLGLAIKAYMASFFEKKMSLIILPVPPRLNHFNCFQAWFF